MKELKKLDFSWAEYTAPLLVPSPDGGHFAAATWGKINIYNIDGTLKSSIDTPHDQVSELEFTPDGVNLIGCKESPARICIWKISGELLFEKEVRQDSVTFSTNRKYIAFLFEDSVGIWSFKTQSFHPLIENLEGVNSIAFSPDESRLALSTMDSKLVLWNTANLERSIVDAHDGCWVLELAFTPDGKHLLTSGEDESVKIWKLE